MKEPLSSYRIFLEVARQKSMSKAANNLYISQPAISKSIQKLEEHLETTLFLRTPKGLTLTDDGQLLYRQATVAFQALDSVESELKHRNELGMGLLKIGASSTLCKYLLLPYLQDFIAAYPNIKISITCQATHETLKLLEDDQIDIGLVGEPSFSKDLTFQTLKQIQDTFVATQSYLDNLDRLGVKKEDYITSSNLMLLDKKNMTRQHIDAYLERKHIEIKDAIDVSNLDLLIEFSKVGVGIACVIRDFVSHELMKHELVEVPTSLHIPPRNVGLAYKNHRLQNPALEKFISFYNKRKKSDLPV